MRKGRSLDHRCARCLMHVNVCICSLEPRIETQTHVVLVLHQLEARKPTNTGCLATRCLPNSRVLLRGGHEPLPHGPFWPKTHQPLLLFPTEDARPLSGCVPFDRPVALIVPDGTWTQASRARRRIPSLAEVPAVTIEANAPSSYRLRTANEPGQVCTMEAIALALELLEGAQGASVRAQLDLILRIMIERTLWTRGRLHPSEVTGGVPAGARPDAPWIAPNELARESE